MAKKHVIKDNYANVISDNYMSAGCGPIDSQTFNANIITDSSFDAQNFSITPLTQVINAFAQKIGELEKNLKKLSSLIEGGQNEKKFKCIYGSF